MVKDGKWWQGAVTPEATLPPVCMMGFAVFHGVGTLADQDFRAFCLPRLGLS